LQYGLTFNNFFAECKITGLFFFLSSTSLYLKEWKSLVVKDWMNYLLRSKKHSSVMWIMFASQIITGWVLRSHASRMDCVVFAILELKLNVPAEIFTADPLVGMCKFSLTVIVPEYAMGKLRGHNFN
jgi:hypothetical protein